MTFVTDLEKTEYTEFVSNHKKGHFMQSYEWGIVSKLKNWQPFYVGLRDNGKLVATALLLKKNMPLGYSYFYIPRGFVLDYNNFELLSEFTNCIKEFTKKHKSLFFKIDPDIKLHTIDKEAQVIDGENNYELVDNLKRLGYKRKPLTKFFDHEQPRFTFRVTLDNEENIDKRYSKTAHRFIKKADGYGVEPFIGTKSDLPEFVRLMKLTEERQGFYSHSEAFYDKFYDIFKGSNHAELMLAKINLENILKTLDEEISKLDDAEAIHKKEEERDFFREKLKTGNEKIVSGYLTVFYGNKAWYLYGANDLEYKMTLANYKLFDFQIKTALNRGAGIFDEFGTIGDPHSDNKLIGLHEFKKKFGGEYTEFIGEFDYITKPFMTKIYHASIPIRRKIGKLKKRGN